MALQPVRVRRFDPSTPRDATRTSHRTILSRREYKTALRPDSRFEQECGEQLCFFLNLMVGL